MNIDRIKRRIRALLNLAEGDGASEGEIDNAMRLAAGLMAEHQLTQADLEAEAQAAQSCGAPEPTMGTADSLCGTSKCSTWERTLAAAVVLLVGSVKCYMTDVESRSGSIFRSETRKAARFFGAAEDAKIAAELFDEWRSVIGAMAVGRFGSVWKGDGAMYSYGFAKRLLERAFEIDDGRAQIVTASTRAIVRVGTGSLSQVLHAKREGAERWLREQQKVNLRKGKVGRYKAGSANAFHQGREDGNGADLSVTRQAKLAGGGA